MVPSTSNMIDFNNVFGSAFKSAATTSF